MTDRQYVCGYAHCLHQGEKVPASSSVVIGKRHYHLDCAALKQKIQDCANTYISYMEDETLYPIVMRIINTMVFDNKIPIDFIKNKIKTGEKYYCGKPVYALYGIRKIFWEYEFPTQQKL